MRPARSELEQTVDELAAEHSGAAFTEAIRALAADLDPEQTTLLQDILVHRAANFDQAVMERVDARGWLQRQWDKATTSSPRDGKRIR